MRDLDECRRSAPHLVAFAELKSDAAESSDLLSARAAELFEEIYRAHPDDPYVTHHLAILHHGRGFQLHLKKQGDSAEAIEFWQRGLQAWARLIKNDGFWNALSEQWTIRQQKYKNDMLVERLLRVDLGAFRRQIPNHLLNFHAAIAGEFCNTNPRLAAAHVQIMLQSGFDGDCIERARKRLHGSIVGDVDRACKELAFDRARQAVDSYLAIDPGYPHAICDALRICTSECEHLGTSEPEINKRIQLLQKAEPLANHGVLREAAKTEMFAAEALRNYHYCLACAHRDRADRLGNASSARKVQYYQEAQKHARTAVQWETCGQKARMCFRQVSINGAVADITLEGSSMAAARGLLDSAIQVNPNDPLLHALKGFYHLRKGDDASFKTELDKAERFNRTANDPEAAQMIANLKQAAESGGAAVQKINELVQNAVQAMQSRNFDRALSCLNEVEGHFKLLKPDDRCAVKWMQTQCHLLLGHAAQAKQCYRETRALMGPNTQPQLRNAIDEVSSLLG